MDNKQIAYRIKKLAKENNTTIYKMSQEIGQGKNIINSLEQRNSSPSIEIIGKIADYFEVSIDYLVGREEKGNINISEIEKMENNQIANRDINIEKGEKLEPLEIELLRSFRKCNKKKQLEILGNFEEN